MGSNLLAMADLRKDDQLQSPQQGPGDHPLFSGKTTVGMISGENPRFPTTTSGHQAMGQALKQMGLKAEEKQGRYGAPERSWMVYGPTREQMYHLGNQFGQESVVFSKGGKHELMYTNGPNAGRFHPALDHEFFQKEPEDYYTHMPDLGGYLRLNFDWNTLNHTNLGPEAAVAALGARAQHPSIHKTEYSLPEVKAELAKNIRAKVMAFYKTYPHGTPSYVGKPHPHAYEWHSEHTDHHLHAADPGVVLRHAGQGQPGHQPITKAMGDVHPHMDGSKPPPVQNEQAAGVGTSTYGKFALPYGHVDKQNPSDLFHYPYHGKNQEIDRLVKDHGYSTYYAGGKYGRPDLANRNYNTKHLMIYDPSPGSGGDFGTEAYTDGWRKIHELAHALTYPDLNKVYGEGRRIGKLGTHRTLREGLRSVHWEWLAAHKQRELGEQIGVHVPDHVFNKELNTVMHDAIHRAVTGKFTEPSGEGFRPHEHKLPLETALGMVRESAHNLGITGMHDLIKKNEGMAMSDEKVYEPQEWRKIVADHIRSRVDAYSKEMVELRKRELAKSDPMAVAPVAAPAPEMTLQDMCPLCGCPDVPGQCKCLQGPAAPMQKDELNKDLASATAELRTQNQKLDAANKARAPKFGMGAPAAQKNEASGYDNVATPPDMGKNAMCAKEEVKKEEPMSVGQDAMKTELAKGKIPDVTAQRPHYDGPTKPKFKTPIEGIVNGTKTGQKQHDLAYHLKHKQAGKINDTDVDHAVDTATAAGPRLKSEMEKAEMSAKAKEPVKAASGNGVKIRPLKLTKAGLPASPKAQMAQHGLIAGSKAAAGAPAAPAPAVKLPGMAAQAARAQTFADHTPPGKFSAPAPAGGPPKLPGMAKPAAPAAPAAGTAHLQGPPAAGAAPKLPGMSKPAAPALPKAPAAAAPKPMAAPKPAAPAPMGKSEKGNDDLKKALGSCALCKKPEHPGLCS